MNRSVYNFAFYLLLPFIVLRLLWRALFLPAPAYARRWGERLGFVASAASGRKERQWIWVHAASVGETVAISPLVLKLREERPDWGVVVTTMTPTGSERIHSLFGSDVCHVYAPYDYGGAVKRFLRTFHPALVILVETELWPNLVHYSKANGASIMVANARLSEKSYRGYLKFAGLGKPMLQQIDLIAAQAESDAERFRKLGVSDENIKITGSIKFDIGLPPDLSEKVAAMRERIEGERPIWIAASTREGEDEKVLSAFRIIQAELPEVLLILVPRHPERFNSAARLFEHAGYTIVRRSSKQTVTADTHVFLGDSMGELLVYLGLAQLAFVGGSLVNTGCQNVLEPAALGLPVVTGPSQYNFQTICEQLEERGALQTVADEEKLAEFVLILLRDAGQRDRMGAAGRQAIIDNQGALERIYKLAVSFLPTC
ncbi:lipid IV(A) 3-deoxy-D-manno-octulosonic acid transferase [Pseudohongiella spirulinae]|uniref:3-deoxy-D-manno-octulosonic acid transferase n=1 Tax=Pseudohongiella spirulinae TaxID=1249552 RepID=A0A0S2K9K8_9GAMM|nr:lipid IV(A) 3-deoxy-D-manno-octulosonic acid transferase [Pseudohongiella spirulinae]ALO45020.1 3-deoxy-D-manno-octulosonic acid transferase [Pseudohongiella spirulinae]